MLGNARMLFRSTAGCQHALEVITWPSLQLSCGKPTDMMYRVRSRQRGEAGAAPSAIQPAAAGQPHLQTAQVSPSDHLDVMDWKQEL